MRESFAFNRLLNASVPAVERQDFSARTAQPQSGAVVRDFKNHAFPMAEERWSVALARSHSMPFGKSCKPEN